MEFEQKEHYVLADAVAIVKLLRDPEKGCPWDKAQTHGSIRQNFIEETYEVVEAIDCMRADMLQEELGDVLLQVLLHAEIEYQGGGFGLDDIADSLCKKLVLRHPHIFGIISADTVEGVLDNWEVIKRREKNQRSGFEAIRDVPHSLPALMRSQKVQERAAYVGFGHKSAERVMQDLELELGKLKTAVSEGTDVEEKLGALLFSAVDAARIVHLSAERALERACGEFSDRFQRAETLAGGRGIEMRDANIEVLDALWDEAKKQSK